MPIFHKKSTQPEKWSDESEYNESKSIRITCKESLSFCEKKGEDKASGDGKNKSIWHIREFLRHPSGVEAILNTRSLQSFQPLDSNFYRCNLPQVQLLNFEVAPVMDLQVTTTNQDCVVEMLSCKFEGSDLVERQNEHFSASLRNHIKWETTDAEPFLDVDVSLSLVLEIYTKPFALLPTSAVEGPGNIMMQTLLDQLVPLLLQQLLQDYEDWVRQQQKAQTLSYLAK